MCFFTVWNTIENETWKIFFDTFNVLQTYYFVTLKAAVCIWSANLISGAESLDNNGFQI